MSGVYNQFRVWFKPWWAKLVFVPVIVVLVGLLVCYKVYNDWWDESLVLGKLMQADVYRSVEKEQIFPDWVVEYVPDVRMYGERVTDLKIVDREGKLDLSICAEFDRLETLSIRVHEQGDLMWLSSFDQLTELWLTGLHLKEKHAAGIGGIASLNELTLRFNHIDATAFAKITNPELAKLTLRIRHSMKAEKGVDSESGVSSSVYKNWTLPDSLQTIEIRVPVVDDDLIETLNEAPHLIGVMLFIGRGTKLPTRDVWKINALTGLVVETDHSNFFQVFEHWEPSREIPELQLLGNVHHYEMLSLVNNRKLTRIAVTGWIKPHIVTGKLRSQPYQYFRKLKRLEQLTINRISDYEFDSLTNELKQVPGFEKLVIVDPTGRYKQLLDKDELKQFPFEVKTVREPPYLMY